MGFSLKIFLDELHRIINDESVDETTKFFMLEETIDAGEKYARECGLIE